MIAQSLECEEVRVGENTSPTNFDACNTLNISNMKHDIVVFPFPEPMFRVDELDKPVEERTVYHDIVICCPYVIDEDAIKVLHTDGKTYLRGCDPMSMGCAIMHERFIPVNQIDKQTLVLMRLNDFLKTKEGLKSLLAVSKNGWWPNQEVGISVEDAITLMENYWLFRFGVIA